MHLLVQQDGSVRCVYGEELELHELGKLTVTRGSHVEPTDDGHWTADLETVGGPQLGPFACRSQALAAEQTWLETHWLLGHECVLR
jgi:hypothetical protein